MGDVITPPPPLAPDRHARDPSSTSCGFPIPAPTSGVSVPEEYRRAVRATLVGLTRVQARLEIAHEGVGVGGYAAVGTGAYITR